MNTIPNQIKKTNAKTRCVTLTAAAGIALLAGAADAQRFHTYSGTERSEVAYDIEQTKDGWVVCGEIRRVDPFNGAQLPADFYVVRYDMFGTPIWSRVFGGEGEDIAYSIDTCREGGFIVAGQTDSVGPDFGVALLRLTDGGVPVWSSAYEGDVFGEIVNPAFDGTPPQVAVREARNGDIVVVANSRFIEGQAGIYLRTDPAGGLAVHQTYPLPGAEFGDRSAFTDIKELPDETLVISGWVDQQVPGTPMREIDTHLMRIDPVGTPIWSNTYANSNFPFAAEMGYGLDADPNGGRLTVSTAFDLGDPAAPFNSQQMIVDAGGGLVVTDQILRGFLPSYSATRFGPNLQTYTAGQDWFLPHAGPAGPVAGFGAGISYAFPLTPRWVYNYGPLTDQQGRLEAVDADLSADGCGAAFAGFKNDFNSPLGGVSDIHMVKVNERGSVGCFEERIPDDQFEFFPQRQPIELQSFRRFEQISWGNDIGEDVNLFVLCRSDTCMDTPVPCSPADITTTGATLMGQPGYLVPDGNADLDDLGVFLNLWLAGDAAADFTTTGATLMGQPGYLVPDGNVDLDDLGVFLNIWQQGCP